LENDFSKLFPWKIPKISAEEMYEKSAPDFVAFYGFSLQSEGFRGLSQD
jgi:hypothetical protein